MDKECTKCESCWMPFSKDNGKRECEKYCSLCFKDGDLCYQGRLDGFQKVCNQSMIDRGMNPWLAWFYIWCIRFAPRWKNS